MWLTFLTFDLLLILAFFACSACYFNAKHSSTVDFHSLRIVQCWIPAPYSGIHRTEPESEKCNPLYGAGIRHRTIRSEWKSTVVQLISLHMERPWALQREICICNSMARSEIWDKFHECCSENGKNCTRRSRVQFAILTTTQVKFIPKFHS